MKLTRSAAAVLVLLALLTWLSWRAINTDAEIYDRALGLLDEFAMVEAALTRDVLSARAGTLRNYDPLVEETNALHELLSRLRGVAVADGGTTAAMDRLAAAVDLQEQLVEHFKSNNALLQNSLVYFGRFNSRSGTVEDLTPLHPAIDALAIAMLHLTLDTSPVSAQEVEQRLNELSQHLAGDDNDAVRGILAHGRLLLQLLPATDNLLKTSFSDPVETGAGNGPRDDRTASGHLASNGAALSLRPLRHVAPSARGAHPARMGASGESPCASAQGGSGAHDCGHFADVHQRSTRGDR